MTQIHLGLEIPAELLPVAGKRLPPLTQDAIDTLRGAGWSRVGLMVPMVTRAAKLLMFHHNKTPKTEAGMIGPLGETSKGIHPVIEQPLETLHRGLVEETGTRDPQTLGLRMRNSGGWFINQWPVGVEFPDEYAFAICPPVYVPPATEERLLTHGHGSEEIRGIEVMTPGEIREMNPARLRPGVIGWLDQLEKTDFLDWPGERSEPIDFRSVFASSMVDLDLQTGL